MNHNCTMVMVMPMMPMTISWGFPTGNFSLVFDSWRVSEKAPFFLSMLFLIAVAFAFEAISYIRSRLDKQWLMQHASNPVDSSASLLSHTDDSASASAGAGVHSSKRLWAHCDNLLVRTLLYALQVAISYYLMLAVMTFVFWFVVAILAGAAAGYAVFSHLRRAEKIPEAPASCCAPAT